VSSPLSLFSIWHRLFPTLTPVLTRGGWGTGPRVQALAQCKAELALERDAAYRQSLAEYRSQFRSATVGALASSSPCAGQGPPSASPASQPHRSQHPQKQTPLKASVASFGPAAFAGSVHFSDPSSSTASDSAARGGVGIGGGVGGSSAGFPLIRAASSQRGPLGGQYSAVSLEMSANRPESTLPVGPPPSKARRPTLP
jgi:hypothetical protein